jgi:hypothetical protein
MKKLSKSEFLDLAKRKTKDIEIPEWNAIITIKSLSAKTALDCQKHFQAGETDKYTYALLANSIVDSDGEYVFTEDECAELDYSVIEVFSPSDFMPKYGKEKQSWQVMLQNARNYVSALKKQKEVNK